MSLAAGTARLFIALELPRDVACALDRWGREQLDGVPGLRRLAGAGLHVTLCFLGSQPVAEIDMIARALGLVRTREAVDLRLGEPLWLPSRRPRVLAVTLEDRGGALAALQSDLARTLRQAGWYEPERRPFLAHVTLARFGRAGGRAVDPPGPPRLSFSGASVALMRSRPGPGGARYERLARISLGARAAS